MERKNNEQIILDMLEEQNYIVTTKEVEALGISSKTITRLVRKGYLRKITKGMYVDTEKFKDKYYEKQARARQGIYSHESALYILGFLEVEPANYKMTIPSHYNTRIITHEDNEFYYLKKNLCGYGMEYIESKYGNLIKVYSIDRTICDLIKDRKRIGEDRLMFLISKYLKYDKKDLKLLKEYAVVLGIEKELEKYII